MSTPPPFGFTIPLNSLNLAGITHILLLTIKKHKIGIQNRKENKLKEHLYLKSSIRFCLMTSIYSPKLEEFLFFVYFFGGLECVGHFFAYVAHLWFLRDSNPEYCRSKLARYRLSHPSLLEEFRFKYLESVPFNLDCTGKISWENLYCNYWKMACIPRMMEL